MPNKKMVIFALFAFLAVQNGWVGETFNQRLSAAFR